MGKYTMLLLDGNTFEHIDHLTFEDESTARETAKRLTAEERDKARAEMRRTVGAYVAVRTLDSINRNTQPSELTVGDLRWLAGEVVDRCDFFLAAPEWAREAIESVPNRKNMPLSSAKHILAAIRCVMAVERKLSRQVEQFEESQANGRKF